MKRASAGAASLWQVESTRERETWNALEASCEVDVLVIGSGLAGLSISRALTARGRKPFVVDAFGVGSGASARNGGFVLVTHICDYPAMRARIGAENARVLLRAAEANHAAVKSVFQAHAHPGYQSAGSLMLSVDGDDAEAAVLNEAHALLKEDGVHAEFVKVPEALAGFAQALHIPSDGEVHPGFLNGMLAEGVHGALATIQSIDFEAHRATTATGLVLAYRDVVIATNAWSANLVPELAGIIDANRGQMLATEPLPKAFESVCYAGWGYEYFRQRQSDGRVLLGGRRALFRDVEHTDESEPTAEVQASLDDYLHRHMPFTQGRAITHRWAGIMGFSPDDLPLVGALPGRDAFILAGFSGHGLGLALSCAEDLAAMISTSATTPLTRLLNPNRFPAMVPR